MCTNMRSNASEIESEMIPCMTFLVEVGVILKLWVGPITIPPVSFAHIYHSIFILSNKHFYRFLYLLYAQSFWEKAKMDMFSVVRKRVFSYTFLPDMTNDIHAHGNLWSVIVQNPWNLLNRYSMGTPSNNKMRENQCILININLKIYLHRRTS